MEPLKVFISSVMRRTLEDLTAEREAARETVESFGSMACAWAFEKAPASTKDVRDAFIDEVKVCDLLLVIVGRTMTPAVREEFDAARDHARPILAYLKNVPERQSEAVQVINLLSSKYDTFASAEDLRGKIRVALEQELLRLIRYDGVEPLQLGDRVAQLRALARRRALVRVAPIIPPLRYDQFRMVGAAADVVSLEKSSQRVTIPASRVSEILVTGDTEPPMLFLDGRLQWITVPRELNFFPEKPDPTDTLQLGFAREVGRTDPYVQNVQQQLASKGLRVTWSSRNRLAERLAANTHEVFYDDTGRYLVSADAILTVTGLEIPRPVLGNR